MAMPIIPPITADITELLLVALPREALNTLPVVVEIILIAVPIRSNIMVIVHAHLFPLISHKTS